MQRSPEKINKDWSKVKEGTLLIITWHDTVEKSSWTPDKDAQEIQPATCKSVGWFVNEDETNIRITSSVADDGDKSIVVIPKGTIRNVQKINYKRRIIDG